MKEPDFGKIRVRRVQIWNIEDTRQHTESRKRTAKKLSIKEQLQLRRL